MTKDPVILSNIETFFLVWSDSLCPSQQFLVIQDGSSWVELVLRSR